MILLDANILIFSRDSSSASHAPAKRWLEDTLNGEPDVRLSVMTLLAFLRLSTHARVFAAPLSAADAIATVQEWLSLPNVKVANPTERHWPLFADLAERGQARGPLLMDAHLAALTIEYGAVLATTDQGFSRFPGLRWINPLMAR